MLEVMYVLFMSALMLIAFVSLLLFTLANLYAVISPYIKNPIDKWWKWFTNRIH